MNIQNIIKHLSIRYLLSAFLFCFLNVFGQKISPISTSDFEDLKSLSADDYGNVYLYKDKNFSLTKLDSTGVQQGRLMMTLPFRVQSIQNILNIVLFSENAQEIKFVDQNLNEIQKLDLKSKFGFIEAAYAEDLQQVWLLDDSTKRLLQYNFRNSTVINAYPLNFDFAKVVDFMVFQSKIYLITENSFQILDFKNRIIFQQEITNPVKLRRENADIFIILKNQILKLKNNHELETVFSQPKANFVDKNSNLYFEVRDSKLYLYNR